MSIRRELHRVRVSILKLAAFTVALALSSVRVAGAQVLGYASTPARNTEVVLEPGPKCRTALLANHHGTAGSLSGLGLRISGVMRLEESCAVSQRVTVSYGKRRATTSHTKIVVTEQNGEWLTLDAGSLIHVSEGVSLLTQVGAEIKNSSPSTVTIGDWRISGGTTIKGGMQQLDIVLVQYGGTTDTDGYGALVHLLGDGATVRYAGTRRGTGPAVTRKVGGAIQSEHGGMLTYVFKANGQMNFGVSEDTKALSFGNFHYTKSKNGSVDFRDCSQSMYVQVGRHMTWVTRDGDLVSAINVSQVAPIGSKYFQAIKPGDSIGVIQGIKCNSQGDFVLPEKETNQSVRYVLRLGGIDFVRGADGRFRKA